MPIPKKTPTTSQEYHRIHSQIRRQLSQVAFNNYYKCARCGGHQQLEIHIPDPDPRKVDQPGFFTILCNICHKAYF